MNALKKIVKKMIKGYRNLRVNEEVVNTQSVALPQFLLQLPPKKEEKIREEKVDGVPIPTSLSSVSLKKNAEEIKRISLTYPLIPRNPKRGDYVYAYAKIFWDEKHKKYMYHVIEPTLTPRIKDIFFKISELLEQRLDVDLSKLNIAEAKDYLKKEIEEILSYFKFRLTSEERRILNYYVNRDFLGMGKIEALMQDPNIEDISCDGVGIPIFVFHRNPKLGSLMTNIVFNDVDELDSFIIRLVQLSGKSISVANPLVDGTLPDGSRLQATLGTDIARRGSNFTIRKFSKNPLTPVHLMNFGTIDAKTLAYLWLSVDYGRSILIAGGTASGKTTFLNVLSLFIRPDKKIISIEDTAELQLPHPHWIPSVARTPISTGKMGEVDLFQLLKESLRQRPDYIILGEVRGQEAYVLFQQMATGHPSLATIHAENMNKLIDRLTTPPISLPYGLLEALDIVVFLQRMKYREKFVRKVTEVQEMMKFKTGSKEPVTNKIFSWDPVKDSFNPGEKSIVLKKIADMSGTPQDEIIEEFKRRVLVLKWMKEKNVTNYRDVYSIINEYYVSPNKIISLIKGGY